MTTELTERLTDILLILQTYLSEIIEYIHEYTILLIC